LLPFFEDFEKHTSANDKTHIDDQIENADWAMWQPHIPPEDVEIEKERIRAIYHQIADSGGEINIHFHVFDPENAMELITALKTYPRAKLRWSVLETAERFPPDRLDGFLVILRVHKDP
jgi:hypothetical protein